MTIVYIHRGSRWCILRSAHPGGRIGTLCLDYVDYGLVLIATLVPVMVCPACARELGAGTPGAATAIEPSRCTTRDLRGPRREDDVRDEWLEVPRQSAVPEIVIEDLVSAGTRRCCARMQYGDGTHGLSCKAGP